MGCRYCMQACPFQVPSYEWDKRLPKMRKCDMCYERQSQGKQTACAEACPVGATKCGRPRRVAGRSAQAPGREARPVLQQDLRREGSRRHLVLYLSAVPFEQIGLRTNVPQEPLPETTWRVLELVPDVVSTGSVLLGGIWWITNRRAEVAKKEGRRK
jgi:formate dehydrogenase iron-sulfur subunit